MIAKLRNTCYRVTTVCEAAIKMYFADTRPHFLPKLLATEGRVLLPNQMNFWKKSKRGRGGGVIFNPKVYVADFGSLNIESERKNCSVIFRK